MSDSFGELTESGLDSLINIPVADAFVLWITGDQEDEGPSDLVNVDTLAHTMTIGSAGAGTYRITVAATVTGNNNSIKIVRVFINGLPVPGLVNRFRLSPSMDMGPLVINGLRQLNPGDVVDVRFTADGNGDTVIVLNCTLAIHAVLRDV